MRVPDEDLARRAEERAEAFRRWLWGHFQDGDRPSALLRALPQLDRETVYEEWSKYLGEEL